LRAVRAQFAVAAQFASVRSLHVLSVGGSPNRFSGGRGDASEVVTERLRPNLQ
jgi:hypothetical protein